MVYLTRRERFNAAHKLWIEEWDQDRNEEVFGKCANPNWHGHNYELFLTVKGAIDPQTGFVADLKDISKLMKEKIVDKLDHKNLNLDVDFMKGKMASTEVLAVEIWNQLKADIEALGCQMHCIKVVETENNYIEYYG